MPQPRKPAVGVTTIQPRWRDSTAALAPVPTAPPAAVHPPATPLQRQNNPRLTATSTYSRGPRAGVGAPLAAAVPGGGAAAAAAMPARAGKWGRSEGQAG